MDEKSLSHTSWNCKYHIVLVPKYRRKMMLHIAAVIVGFQNAPCHPVFPGFGLGKFRVEAGCSVRAEKDALLM